MKKNQEHKVSAGVAVRTGLAAGGNCMLSYDKNAVQRCEDGYLQRKPDMEGFLRCMNSC